MELGKDGGLREEARRGKRESGEVMNQWERCIK